MAHADRHRKRRGVADAAWTPRPRLSSPVGGGGPPEGWWRGSNSSSALPAGPLHHAAHGPPPPTGEERRSVPLSRPALVQRLADTAGELFDGEGLGQQRRLHRLG